jgi:enamine deaminase RidA (YjgF/YER057c/UK114 family)
MKIPKRISEILKRKQEFIDASRDELEKSVIKLQSQLLSDIISNLIPELDIKDGMIQDNAKNYRLLSVLDKTYRDFQVISNNIVLSQIVNTTAKIADLSQNYFSVMLTGNLPARFESIITKTDKLINLQIGLEGDKIFKGGWLDSFFNSGTSGLELKEMTSKAVTSNMNMKDFVSMLKDKVTGTVDYKGTLEKKFDAFGYDLYQQYDAAYNLTLGNEFGFIYFIYQGGLINDSRDFCAAHNNKVWSKEEMKTWATWTPSQGEYPAGYVVKAKDISAVPSYLGYPGYDPGLNRGGYRCRHALGWIDEKMAKDLRPDLK